MKTSNKKVSFIAATAFTAVFSQGVLASEYTSSVENTLDSNDLSFAFAQTDQPVQVLALSEQEMKETEGAAVPIWAGGAVVGGGTYIGSTLYRSWDGTLSGTAQNFKNNWSAGDFGFAVVSGAVGGTYGQALFRELGYKTFGAQLAAPLSVQLPIRTGGAGLGFATFGVHGYATTKFNSGVSNFSNGPSFGSTCYSCYRAP